MGTFYVDISNSWDGNGGSGGALDPFDYQGFVNAATPDQGGNVNTYKIRGSRLVPPFNDFELRCNFNNISKVFVEAWDISTYGPWRVKIQDSTHSGFRLTSCNIRDAILDNINGNIILEDQITLRNSLVMHDGIDFPSYSGFQHKFEGVTFFKLTSTNNCYGGMINGSQSYVFNDCVLFWPSSVGFRLHPFANSVLSWNVIYQLNNTAIGAADTNNFIGNVGGKPSYYHPTYSSNGNEQLSLVAPTSYPAVLTGAESDFTYTAWTSRGAGSISTPPQPGQSPYTGYTTGLFGEARTGIGGFNFGAVPTAPSVVSQPSPLTKNEGQSATFTFVVDGTLLTYVWRKNGVDIDGANSNTLHFASVVEADEADYRCVAFNSAGAEFSDTVHLTVNAASVAPDVTDSPDPITRLVGGSAVFTVVATGDPAPTYLWRKNGDPLSNDMRISGVDTDTLTISDLVLSDDANYDCLVENTAGSDLSDAAHLTMHQQPQVQVDPNPVTGLVGQSVEFSISAIGTPSPTYQWRKGLSSLSNDEKHSGVDTNTLTIHNLELSDEGNYNCVVENEEGSDASSDAALTVHEVPTFDEQPESSSRVVGQIATFSLVAHGIPSITYLWHKGETPLVNGGRFSGVDTDTLTISSVQLDDAGDYFCLISNVEDDVLSEPATLTVVPGTTNTDGDVQVTIEGEDVVVLSNLPDLESSRVYYVYVNVDGDVCLAKKPVGGDDLESTLGTDASEN